MSLDVRVPSVPVLVSSKMATVISPAFCEALKLGVIGTVLKVYVHKKGMPLVKKAPLLIKSETGQIQKFMVFKNKKKNPKKFIINLRVSTETITFDPVLKVYGKSRLFLVGAFFNYL